MKIIKVKKNITSITIETDEDELAEIVLSVKAAAISGRRTSDTVAAYDILAGVLSDARSK